MLPLPLALHRVLDLSASAAGGYATRLLGDLGAEVIRVDRAAVPGSLALPGARLCNKLSFGVDIAQAAGRDLVLRLAALSNFAVVDGEDAGRTAAGLTDDALLAARASLVLVTIAGDRPEAGLAAAGAAFAALFHHRATGEGQRAVVDAAAVALSVQSDSVLIASSYAEGPPAESPVSGRYACADGRSLVLAVRSEDERLALGAVVGALPPADDAVLRAAVERWLAERAAAEAADALLAAGVAAQPVVSAAELLTDRQLDARGFFEPVAHPDSGVRPLLGVPYRFSRTPAHIRLPAPAPGQHNDYVLRGLLGLPPDAIATLEQAGIVAGPRSGAQ